MITKRIIPCLDVRNGRTVKGICFDELRDAGDPVELGLHYAQQGADELVFLDITATQQQRATQHALVQRVAQHLDIPFTVGGGIRSVQDVAELLRAGADKVSVNSAALYRPDLIDELAREFGSQCVVVAIDAAVHNGQWCVYAAGGMQKTPRELYEWSREVQERGAGEILFTSIAHDGTKSGFAVEALARLAREVHLPVIASGGGGAPQHFLDVFATGQADAALAASVFHFQEISIPALKQFLHTHSIPVRYEREL